MRNHARSAPDRAPRDERAPARAAQPAALGLQRTIGNRATAQVLARREESRGSVLLEGIDDPIPILSFQHDARSKDVLLTSTMGDHSATFLNAILDRSFPSADITLRHPSGSMHVVLTNAIATSYSVSGGGEPVESWSLGYSAIKYIYPSSGPIPE